MPFREQGIEISMVDPQEVTRELAAGVAIVASDAYAARFTDVPKQDIADWQEADVTLPEHIDTTLGYLQRGPEQHWYWSVATQKEMGYMAVLGFSLVIASDNDAFLAELHTHPNAQRMGIARATAAAALRTAAQDPIFTDVNHAQTVLNVARRRPSDDTEHPAAWYRSLGYRRVGEGAPVGPVGYEMPTDRMRASLQEVLARLERS